MDCLISVIVPVYKVENYIHRCIDSIIAQTFTEFELVLVDDGSPDNCGKICDEYALKDKRIHVIHKENGGLSDARNAGIDWTFENSDSEWLTFIDSDDWVHKKYLESLINGAINTNSDVVIGGFQLSSDSSPNVNVDNLNAIILTPEEMFCKKHVAAVIACGKLYTKKLFKSVRFPVGKFHEDEYITYKLLFKYSHIAFIDEPIYAYYSNPESITRQQWSPRRMDKIQAYYEQMEFFQGNGMYKALRFVQWNFIRDLAIGVHSLYDIDKKQYSYRKRQLRKAIRKYIKYQSYGTRDEHMIYSAAYPNKYKLKKYVRKKYCSVLEVLNIIHKKKN